MKPEILNIFLKKGSFKSFPKRLQPTDSLEYFHHSALISCLHPNLVNTQQHLTFKLSIVQFGKLGKQSRMLQMETI